MTELEPLGRGYDEESVQTAVAGALKAFYQGLTNALNRIELDRVLKKKNPYLYRAKGCRSAAEIVDSILAAYVSSSEETIFGNTFFEPLALALSGGQKAVTEGVDITVDTGGVIYSIAVKSGTSVFNADSRKRQEQNFQAAQRRARQAHKAFFPVVGYGYGRRRASEKRGRFYTELAGQDFWNWLTGDPDFYLKIVRCMGAKPDDCARRLDEAYARAENRMVRAFTERFCFEDGSVDWDALIRLNSGRSRSPRGRRKT